MESEPVAGSSMLATVKAFEEKEVLPPRGSVVVAMTRNCEPTKDWSEGIAIEAELAPEMFNQEEPELSCHWKSVEVEPSGSETSDREALSVCPSAGVPEMKSEPVAGSSMLATEELVADE